MSQEQWPVEVWAENLRATASLLEETAKRLREHADSLEKRFTVRKKLKTVENVMDIKINQDVFTKSVDTPLGELMIDPGDYIRSNLAGEHTHDPHTCAECKHALKLKDPDKALEKLGPRHLHDPSDCSDCIRVEDQIRELAENWQSAYDSLMEAGRAIRKATSVDGNDWTRPD